jgi:hypothetical protein
LGEFFLSDGNESCDQACSRTGLGVCDANALKSAASSINQCKSIINNLGFHPQKTTVRAGINVDQSGCCYHPGQTGYAQLKGDGDPECGVIDPDKKRRRVCSCKEPPTTTDEISDEELVADTGSCPPDSKEKVIQAGQSDQSGKLVSAAGLTFCCPSECDTCDGPECDDGSWKELKCCAKVIFETTRKQDDCYDRRLPCFFDGLPNHMPHQNEL